MQHKSPYFTGYNGLVVGYVSNLNKQLGSSLIINGTISVLDMELSKRTAITYPNGSPMIEAFAVDILGSTLALARGDKIPT